MPVWKPHAKRQLFLTDEHTNINVKIIPSKRQTVLPIKSLYFVFKYTTFYFRTSFYEDSVLTSIQTWSQGMRTSTSFPGVFWLHLLLACQFPPDLSFFVPSVCMAAKNRYRNHNIRWTVEREHDVILDIYADLEGTELGFWLRPNRWWGNWWKEEVGELRETPNTKGERSITTGSTQSFPEKG